MLHHVALGARDVERVAAFYRRAFDLQEVARHHDDGGLRSVWLGLGAAVLMIERTEAPAVPVTRIGAGPFLLAFPVDSSERAAREARLLELGAAIDSRTAHTSYARDPEGNRVALSAYPLAKGSV